MPRREDERLLRGRGRYLLDDVPGDALHAVLVRSPHAHARILGIDRSALGPDVVATLTGAELEAEGLGPLLATGRVNPHTGEPFAIAPQTLLAVDTVRHVGEAVVLVVARSRAAALDAAEAVAVDYQPLPAVVGIDAALAPGAPLVHPASPGNRALDWCCGDEQATAAAFAAATHVVSIDCVNHRVAASPMEPRGCIARFEQEQGYTLDVSSQNVHVIRDLAAAALGERPGRLRVRAPDVGGGFGTRNFIYPEYVLALWAARRCARAVCWQSTRSEGFISDHQARDLRARAQLALDGEGRFLALRMETVADIGAWAAGASVAVQTGQLSTLPAALYDVPAISLRVGAVLTHSVPVGVTRGPGFAEAVDVMERLIDRAARVTGLDRVALRRRNLVAASSMPWTSALGTVVDSGDPRACLDAALAAADLDGFPARRAAAARRGRLRGIGLACHVKATGGLPEENVALAFGADRLTFTTGTMAIGQGHETTFRQILTTLLGVAPEAIDYVAADTAAIAMGGGHGSSRATYMAGTAMALAVDAVAARGSAVLAAARGVAAAQVRFEAGHFHLPDSNESLDVFEVARLAREAGDSLDVYQHFERRAMTFPSGCHVAEVEVDADTGVVQLVGYTAVDDYGVEVNPRVVRGQMHGAIAQGVGQALGEQVRYEADSGQCLSGSFLDYPLPRAADLPDLRTGTRGTRCTTNPLGAKGCGEAGAIAAPPALANAVLDALAGHGVEGLRGPATPHAIWTALQAGAERR